MTKRRHGELAFKRSRARAVESQSKVPAWTWMAGGGVLLVLAVIGLFYLGNQRLGPVSDDIEGALIFPEQGRGHQEGDIVYPEDAPVGGIHSPEWLNCGIYEQPVRRENVIHSMEHGAVWIAYQSELPTEQVETLRTLVRQEQAGTQERWIVLAPQPGLDDPVVASAWRVQLRLDDASDPRLVQFVKKYQKGPYYPEPGATCTFGGIGEPMS
ncbi:MAG: hypothetical protein BroJett011_04540 [Chloroflexota bacterium]|nr:MAG: hypothetical protein BroJett011_04540 [Chloroflexota bacterium]